ncbi:hypothetical protein [Pigmentiphaga sp. NML080357]|uniref:hypothetical protein n=1 Tax=Pigmentiphaga sp. NML080357 TaxID=2008675 RepID=UPI001184F0C5|nr:hypothetical protein [Pigmentiphaga sp. NML080357]
MKRLSHVRKTLFAAALLAGAPLAIAQTGSSGTTGTTHGTHTQRQNDSDARTDMGPSTGSSGKPLPAGQGKNNPPPESSRKTGPVEHGSRSDMGPSSGAPGKPLPAGRGGSDTSTSNPPSQRSMPGGNDRDARTDMGPSTGSSGKPVPSPDSGGSSGSTQR